MNILLSTPFAIYPTHNGAALRTHCIGQALTKLGHRVTILSPKVILKDKKPTPYELVHYNQNHRWNYFINSDLIKTLRKQLERPVDLIISEFPYQFPMLHKISKSKGIALIYDAHNLETIRFKRQRGNLYSQAIYCFEKYACEHSTAIFTVSEKEQKLFFSLFGKTPYLLPNGVDMKPLVQSPNPQKPYLFCYGNFSYKSNLKGLLHFLNEHWLNLSSKKAELELVLSGVGIPKEIVENFPKVKYEGIAKEVLPLIDNSVGVVLPLFTGGGTRIRILEVLSRNRAVITTPIGAEGICANNSHGLFVKKWPALGDEILRVIENQTDYNGRAFCHHFEWENLVAQVDWEKLAHQIRHLRRVVD